MTEEKDFLEEMIYVWTEKDPTFRAAFAAAWQQREKGHKRPLDDLDRFIAERTAKNPGFPQLMETTRRQRLRGLAEEREEASPEKEEER